ncbi:hypothetical protein ABI59_12370 [Acidobacteria bacterium Mor1]|nr:hypothetical protein ABI59_12370 [Acidobacteria bacterium Mor1]
MRIAIVGGGLLGLTMAHRLAGPRHQVSLFEAAPQLGGLSAGHDYGPFTWDRYYHCVLPQDQRTVGLLQELGLENRLRWKSTRTGYWAGDTFYEMSGNADFARFPLLNLIDKGRLAWSVIWATRFADPEKLHRVSAQEWLTRICGKRTFEVFWLPMLRAKFGEYHDRVSAVFIWATLTRLMRARSSTGAKEQLGYIGGGYTGVFEVLERSLLDRGAELHLGRTVEHLARSDDTCSLRLAGDGENREFDRVLFTAPARIAAKAADERLKPEVEKLAAQYPTASSYLGVICMALVLPEPLTPYYVLNLGQDVGLTGVIEMTNLVDPVETAGRRLVYLPLYLDSEDPRLSWSDEKLREMFLAGLGRLFPAFDLNTIENAEIHRARYVQPLPLVRGADEPVADPGLPRDADPFQWVNTSMLRCTTLNNNEVIALADAFLEGNGLGETQADAGGSAAA